MDNFFDLNLGKLPNYVQYFGSNIVEVVAESSVGTEVSWVEVDGAGWGLKWAGWSCVHGLVIPLNIPNYEYCDFLAENIDDPTLKAIIK